jgi:hypothetical protein
MSLYEGTITLRLRFFSSNGVEADENLKDMGLEIATAVNSNCVDPDDATMPDDGCYIVAGYEASSAERA